MILFLKVTRYLFRSMPKLHSALVVPVFHQTIKTTVLLCNYFEPVLELLSVTLVWISMIVAPS